VEREKGSVVMYIGPKQSKVVGTSTEQKRPTELGGHGRKGQFLGNMGGGVQRSKRQYPRTSRGKEVESPGGKRWGKMWN